MERRGFFRMAAAGLAGVAQLGAAQTGAGSGSIGAGVGQDGAKPGGRNQSGTPMQVVIERAAQGQPSKGKVFALISPHLDDGPIFAGGTMAKLLQEGYKGYIIRTSNDDKDSVHTMSIGETVLANEQDVEYFVKNAGFERSFNLNYTNHMMDAVPPTELRSRLIFLFRLLKVDTVFSYDPWGHYEENPDHYVTAKAVESACWMTGGGRDFTEHFAAGVMPHGVSEKYYFARGPQLVNRAVDIGPTMAKKIEYIHSCRTMLTNMVGSDAKQAQDAFIQKNFVARDKAVGQVYGLEAAEEFHYIGKGESLWR
jgi:LmbE family N-acetylglucosaminyl deacetylase